LKGYNFLPAKVPKLQDLILIQLSGATGQKHDFFLDSYEEYFYWRGLINHSSFFNRFTILFYVPYRPGFYYLFPSNLYISKKICLELAAKSGQAKRLHYHTKQIKKAEVLN
jgi:hypothetical protein